MFWRVNCAVLMNLMNIGLLMTLPLGAGRAETLLAVDFGGTLPNGPLQAGMQGFWGSSYAPASATFGSYGVQISSNNTQTGVAGSRGFYQKLGGRIDNTPADVRDFYRDFYYNRSTVNGEGISLTLTGLTPNVPYNLTLVSFDADASPTVTTVQNWGPTTATNTTGTSASINMLRVPEPATIWDSSYAGTIEVSTTTGTLDIFGTTSAGARGTVLNGFKLNDGTIDVLVVDLAEGSEPLGDTQPGFQSMIGPEFIGTQSQTFGEYNVTVAAIGGAPFDSGFDSEHDDRMTLEKLSSTVHALYRDYYYNNSTAEGEGVLLTIDGVEPDTDYDVKIWTFDAANPNATPTVWSPVLETTGESATIVNVRVPAPTSIDDPAHSDVIRVRSSTTSLNMFGTTTSGPTSTGGTRLNAFTLSAVVDDLLGDFNGDGNVDAADYVVWRKLDNTETGYTAWVNNFGRALNGSGGNESVPEPTAVGLALLAAVATVAAGRKRRG